MPTDVQRLRTPASGNIVAAGLRGGPEGCLLDGGTLRACAPIGKVVPTVQRLGRSNWRGFQLDIVFRCVQFGSIHARTLDLMPAILVVQVAGTRPLERRLTCGRD